MRAIGLDVHKRFADLTVLEPGKGIQRRPRLETTPTALRAFAQTLGPEDHVALEASANTWAIADLLSAHAGRVVVSNPMRTQAIASAKVKTDRVDSAILAQLLAADFLPPVWIPDSATQALRRQVAHRQTLVQQSTRLRNRIHAILHRNLVEHPFSDLLGKAGRRWLATVPVPGDERSQVESALRLLHALETEIRLIDRSLAHTALNDERVPRLMTIPGVGVITAIQHHRRDRRCLPLLACRQAGRLPGPGSPGAPVWRSSRSHGPHQPAGPGPRSRLAGGGRSFGHSCS